MNLPNTTMRVDGNFTIWQLYQTEIVKYSATLIVLNTGGFDTSTTRRRMNQIAEFCNLGFTVGYKQGKPYAIYKGMTLFFQDNVLIINRTV